MIKTALISVWDKTGIVEFVDSLIQMGISIISTGGTYKALDQAGLNVIKIEDITGFESILDGRVKTLDAKIHGGILADRNNKKHLDELKQHDIGCIDMVVVNLYPFEKTIEHEKDEKICLENIDIGGPTMIRAAAKNYQSVSVITNPNIYSDIIYKLQNNNKQLPLKFRKQLAFIAFSHTAYYDGIISHWISKDFNGMLKSDEISFAGRKKEILRYGENAHQEATLYSNKDDRSGVVNARKLQGKELSFNNIADANAAFELASEFTKPSCIIVKHQVPCGVASAKNALEALDKALACDPVSAFGGVVAFNTTIDLYTAKKLTEVFFEVIIAPFVSPEALDFLATKPKLRVLQTDAMPNPRQKAYELHSISGGFLVQEKDTLMIQNQDCQVVTKKVPTDDQWSDMIFAMKVAKHTRSNAIVLAKDAQVLGVGAGQTSRLDASEIALSKAKKYKLLKKDKGFVAASDAFYPFPDALEILLKSGVKAVIQPGGSIKDDLVIETANKYDIAMVFSGIRHFRH